MLAIDKPIRAAKRRLNLQRFINLLGRCVTYVGCIVAIVIVVAKFTAVPMSFERWTLICALSGAIAAVLAATIWTYIGRFRNIDAAVLVDKRLKLNERLATASQLSPELLATPMGAALLADASTKAERLDVRDAFPIRLPAYYLQWLLPLAVIAFAAWLPPVTQTQVAKAEEETISLTQVKNSTEPLLKQVKAQREQAEKEKLDDAEFFRNLEAEIDALRAKPPTQEKKFLADLKKMQDKLQERRDALGDASELKKQLTGLKKIDDGPAEKLAEAMKDGELEEASDQVQELMEKMEKGELSEEESEQLQNQLQQMQAAMEEAIKVDAAEQEQLKQQIEQAQAAGDSEAAAQLQQKLEQKQANASTTKAMQEMADSLSEAGKSMKQGDSKAAAEAMAKMQSQLKKMAKNQQQSKNLKELSESMAECKSCSSCSQCNGKGCKSCNSLSKKFTRKDFADGEGRGEGFRDEQAEDTSDYDSQVRGNVQEGETAFGGRIDGENKKTATQMQVRQAILASEAERPDALEDADLPKAEQQMLKEYFNALRTGE